MGHVYAEIELSNPRRTLFKSLRVQALVDTGAMTLCIPEHVAIQLGLETEYEREVSFADGCRRKVPYVGPLRVVFANRGCFVGALVVGDEVLLGAIPMEDLDLVVAPGRGTLIANFESPNIPHARAKSESPGIAAA